MSTPVSRSLSASLLYHAALLVKSLKYCPCRTATESFFIVSNLGIINGGECPDAYFFNFYRCVQQSLSPPSFSASVLPPAHRRREMSRRIPSAIPFRRNPCLPKLRFLRKYRSVPWKNLPPQRLISPPISQTPSGSPAWRNRRRISQGKRPRCLSQSIRFLNSIPCARDCRRRSLRSPLSPGSPSRATFTRKPDRLRIFFPKSYAEWKARSGENPECSARFRT